MEVIDTHVHLNASFSGGLPNEWVAGEGPSFQKDWSEADLLSAASAGGVNIKSFVFVECFNRSPADEVKWVQSMVDSPDSKCTAYVCQIYVQKGAKEVTDFLASIKVDGELPSGLRGARMVFPASDNNAPDACLDPIFHEGLAELEKAGLHWEFCVNPNAAPNLATVCAKFPNMTFIIDHLAHNGNDGGDMEAWGPAMDALGRLPNVFAKMGATEEWGVEDPGAYMDRAIAAFGFDKILYESNWFVNEAMGKAYPDTYMLLMEACKRAGATEADLTKVFSGNAKRAYRLD